MSTMKVTTLVPWYGSNRSLAHEVGRELSGCGWVGVPFAGGMCELRHIKARTIVVGDIHKHLINMARVASDPVTGPQFYRQAKRIPLHPGALAAAQDTCRSFEGQIGGGLFGGIPEDEQADALTWALAYYVNSWMTRNGSAGTDREFMGGLCTRWDAGGGDSAKRYQNAVRSTVEWRRIMARCTFECRDAFDFLACCKDSNDTKAGPFGIYCDPPFPGPGDKYKHPLGSDGQVRLAKSLARFRYTRVVCRFYDHPLIRELYPEDRWIWRHLTGGKKQTNAEAPEVLLINGPSFAGGEG